MRHCVKEVDSLFHLKVRWGEDNVTAAIGLEIFSLDSIDSSHPLLKAE